MSERGNTGKISKFGIQKGMPKFSISTSKSPMKIKNKVKNYEEKREEMFSNLDMFNMIEEKKSARQETSFSKPGSRQQSRQISIAQSPATRPRE